MKKQKEFTIKCRRCGRLFKTTHGNELYCSYPSIYPEDKGRTCKQMRRVESKEKTKKARDDFERKLQDGKYVVTEKYGCIPRDVLENKFFEYVSQKHNLKSYLEYQRWCDYYTEEVGTDYDEFQKEIGMKVMDAELENNESED